MSGSVKWLDQNCHNCGTQLNSWDERCSKALKYRYLHCESCIAKEYGLTTNEVRATMEHHFGIVPCMGL